VCIFQYSTLAEGYYSFGRTVNKSFGEPNEKIILTEDIFVPAEGKILDIDLALNIEHTSICDLWIYIRSPDGTSACINSYDKDIYGVRMFEPNRVDFYWTVFDDESPISIDSGKSPLCGLYRPNGPGSLSDFYGQQSCGTWQVKICDRRFADTGIFKGVRLDFHIDTEPSIELLSADAAAPEPSTGLLFAISALIATLRGRSRPV